MSTQSFQIAKRYSGVLSIGRRCDTALCDNCDTGPQMAKVYPKFAIQQGLSFRRLLKR